MKRIISALVCAVTVLSLCSCTAKREKLPSNYDELTDKLSQTVETLFETDFEEKLEALMSSPYIVAATLIIYGVIFIVVESLNKNKEFKINDLKDLTIRTAVIIGLFQVLSMIPGTSRSGITIIGAMLIGTARTEAAEFTFFLGIPTMIGASLLKILGFIKDGGGFTGAEMGYLLVGMAVSFVVSVIVIKFLMSFIKKHDFKAFGIYRIILGIAVIAYLLIA